MNNKIAGILSAKNAGFTLLEVMIAAGILAIGCFGILRMLLTAQDNNNISSSRSEAVIIAERYQSAMENESRAAVLQNGTFTLASNNKAILTSVTNPSLSNQWVWLGRVNALAINANAAGVNEMVAREPNRFCIGIFNRPVIHGTLFTGAIRVYWRKDNRELTERECQNNAFFAQFDELAANDVQRNYTFISIPYSVMPGVSNRLPVDLGAPSSP